MGLSGSLGRRLVCRNSAGVPVSGLDDSVGCCWVEEGLGRRRRLGIGWRRQLLEAFRPLGADLRLRDWLLGIEKDSAGVVVLESDGDVGCWRFRASGCGIEGGNGIFDLSGQCFKPFQLPLSRDWHRVWEMKYGLNYLLLLRSLGSPSSQKGSSGGCLRLAIYMGNPVTVLLLSDVVAASGSAREARYLWQHHHIVL